MEYEIAGQILEAEVDVILGGGSSYFTSLNPIGAGYTIVETSEELMNLESGKILGLFTTSYMSYESERDPDIEPSLAEMTEKSIELLSSDPDGFFLMIEGGRIDFASHDNDFEGTMSEVYAFDLAVKEALMFAARRNDTLVIVTADHETGGLLITGGYSSSSIRYEWIGTGHTGSMVPVLAYGPRAEAVLGFSDNADVGSFLLSVFE
jgi:alkaline phosphatase